MMNTMMNTGMGMNGMTMGGAMYPNMNNGTFYGTQAQQPQKMTQLLKPEELEQLLQNKAGDIMTISKEDQLRAYCTHKNGNNIAVTLTADGEWFCPICKQKFANMENVSDQEIEQLVKNMTDLLQNIKLTYIDMPYDIGRAFFRILPLVDKIPELYKASIKNFRMHTSNTSMNSNHMGMGSGMYSALMGGVPIPQMGMGMAPNMGMNMQQQMIQPQVNMGMAPNIGMAPSMGMSIQQQMGMNNPFSAAEAAQMNGMGVAQPQMQQPVQPVQPVQQEVEHARTSFTK